MLFKNVIAAIDFTDDLALAVLKTAAMLAKRDEAKLWVVDVWPDLQYPMTTGIADPLGATAMLPSEANMEADRKAKALRKKELKVMAKDAYSNAKAVVLSGDPAREITEFAKQKNADLLVVGTHQKGAWKALFDGAASRDIVRDAPCAIFLVPQCFAEKVLAG